MQAQDYIRLFDKMAYLQYFRDLGRLHLNNICTFSNMDDDFRNDKYEGMCFRTCDNVELYVSEKPFLDDEAEKLALFADTRLKNIFVYCFYTVYDGDIDFVDNKIVITNPNLVKCLVDFKKEYKDLFVVMLKATELEAKINNTLVNTKYGFGPITYKEYDIVERSLAYLQNNYKSIILTKPIKYSFQNESRLFLQLNSELPFVEFDIPNLKECVVFSGEMKDV